MFSKKGMQWTIIIGLIALLLFVTLYIIFSTHVKQVTLNTADRELCKYNVLERARIKPLGKSLGDLNSCQTNSIVIDKIQLNEINDALAREMSSCLNQFGYEKDKPMPDFLSDWDFAGSDTWCFVCSDITFGKAVQKKYEAIGGFDEYLNNNNVPLLNITWRKYLNIGTNDKITSVSSINPKEPLYVVFFANKGTSLKSMITSGGVAGVGTVILTTIVPTTISAFVCGPCAAAVAPIAFKIGLVFGVAGAGMEAATNKPYFYPGIALTSSQEIIKSCKELKT